LLPIKAHFLEVKRNNNRTTSFYQHETSTDHQSNKRPTASCYGRDILSCLTIEKGRSILQIIVGIYIVVVLYFGVPYKQICYNIYLLTRYISWLPREETLPHQSCKLQELVPLYFRAPMLKDITGCISVGQSIHMVSLTVLHNYEYLVRHCSRL